MFIDLQKNPTACCRPRFMETQIRWKKFLNMCMTQKHQFYNSEIELSAIINLVYLSARDTYRVEREDKAGKGFVDFIFYPKRTDDPGMILELKINHSPQEAIKQIKEKNYKLRFQGKIGEVSQYKRKVLAVGISYDKKTKKHDCEIEWI